MFDTLNYPTLTGPIVAFLTAFVLIPVARMLAIKAGFVDQPGGRKQHEDPVPPIGGLIIFPVFIAVSLWSGADVDSYGYLYIALIIIVTTGAIDDRIQLSAWIKFGMQFLASCIIVLPGDAQLYHLGNLFGFGNLGLGVFSIPFSLAAVMLLINAINLMDGLDGLAGGKSLMVMVWLTIACIIAGEVGPILALGPLMAVLIAFLFYNMRHPFRKKASLFLGDAGSMGLGLCLAWFSIALAQNPHPVLVPISVAWILALPIIDACGQFYRRVREGRHPFDADRGHFHHHFIHAGVPVGQSTATILLLGFVLGGIGYFGVLIGVPQVILTCLWLALLFSHMSYSNQPDKYIAAVSRFLPKGQRLK